jgi:hypothetical protein
MSECSNYKLIFYQFQMKNVKEYHETTECVVEFNDNSSRLVGLDLNKTSLNEMVVNEAGEVFKLRKDLNMLKTENEHLKTYLIELMNNFRTFQNDYKTREKLHADEMKTLRKKVVYLLKRNLALSYATDDEENDAEERVVKF